MTTIAFKDGVMASDTLALDGANMSLGPCDKIFRTRADGLLGTSGAGDTRDILELLEEVGHPDEFPTKAELIATETEFVGLLWIRDGTLWLIEMTFNADDDEGWNASVFELRLKFMAIGTGAMLAIGAMARGATAVGAVGVAMTFDTMTGGEVVSVSVPEGD